MNLTSSAVPAGPGDLTASVISRALGRSVVVTEVERVGEEFGFSGETYRVGIEVSGGPPAVIAKLWALRDPDDVRELHFYRELAAETPAPLPAFHHGGADRRAGRAWLVLEALDRFRQGDDLVEESLDTVLRLVETIALVHAAWRDRVADRPWLTRAPRLRRDAEYLTLRRREYLERFGPIPDPLARRLFDEIPALVPLAAELLDGAPETLLHLDLGLDNVLFLLPGDRPVPIDWARCGRGPGVHDLASILFVIAPLAGFADVVDCYVAAVETASSPVGANKVRRWLDGAMIHEFITRTLGVARWSATTPRGLAILDRWVARTPQVVGAWRSLDPGVFERLGP